MGGWVTYLALVLHMCTQAQEIAQQEAAKKEREGQGPCQKEETAHTRAGGAGEKEKEEEEPAPPPNGRGWGWAGGRWR